MMNRLKKTCYKKSASRRDIWFSKSKPLGFFRQNNYGGKKNKKISKAKNRNLTLKQTPGLLLLLLQMNPLEELGKICFEKLV